METLNKICLIVVAVVVIFIIIVSVKQNGGQTSVSSEKVLMDTTYNTKVLDSIEYNIIVKDSIIHNIKIEMRDEIAESFELNDSDAIKLFKELAGTK